jgi:hypothetical protein
LRGGLEEPLQVAPAICMKDNAVSNKEKKKSFGKSRYAIEILMYKMQQNMFYRQMYAWYKISVTTVFKIYRRCYFHNLSQDCRMLG